MDAVARLLVFAGLALATLGLVVMLAGRIPFLGRLPGDISYQRGNFSFNFPIVTCVVISIVLTLALNLFDKIFRK